METVGAEQLDGEKSVFVCDKENEEKDAVTHKCGVRNERETEERRSPLPKGRLAQAERVRAFSIKGL